MATKTILRDDNADPITGEPGSHPIGTGIGAAGGAAAGAAVGTAAGPIGTATGAVIGAIAGGIAGGFVGKEVAEYVNPTDVNAYWEENYQSRPYYNPGLSFENYRPAYKLGYEEFARNPDREFAHLETGLGEKWESSRGNSSLDWEEAKHAVRDSFNYTSNQYKTKLNQK